MSGWRFERDACLTAVQFLTQVPVPGGMSRPGADPSLLPASVAYFPLVGTLVGTATGLSALLFAQLWPVPVAVVMALAVEAVLTGAFHEDAVADSCDAFGGGWTRDDILRIMADSRVGSFGALGLGLTVALRALGLASVQPEHLALVTAAAGGLGRLGVVLLMNWVPPVQKPEGLAKDIGRLVTRATLARATLWLAPLFAVTLWLHPPLLFLGVAATLLVTFAWGRYVRSRLGGVTGDCLGACAMFCQVAVVLAVVARS